MEQKVVRVLFVCMGNICRSPTAQGIFHNLLQAEGLDAVVETDSAGTHAYHVGERPDTRATRAAAQRGIDLSSQRARRVAAEDFAVFLLQLAVLRMRHHSPFLPVHNCLANR